MEKIKILTTIEEIKAYNEPYRMEILINFLKLERPATGKEIADIMGEVPSKVHYHFKKMEQAGIIKIAYTKEINGIVAKYYEPTAENFKIKNEYLNESSKKVMNGEIAKTISKSFDNAKQDFINHIENEDKNKVKSDGLVQYSKIYLTNEEIENIKRIMEEYSKKNKDKNTDKKEFYMFFSIIGDKKI